MCFMSTSDIKRQSGFNGYIASTRTEAQIIEAMEKISSKGYKMLKEEQNPTKMDTSSLGEFIEDDEGRDLW